MTTGSSTANLLIIGGSGFLSGTLARTALGDGWKVWAVTRGRRALPAGVINLVADRRDATAFESAITGVQQRWDLVVDCIGYEPADARQDIAVFRNCAHQLVFISTDFVFDPARRKFPQAEDPAHYVTGGYGGGKRQCELELLNGDAVEMACTIVRPCHIYGPGSELGCLPLHGRDPGIIARLREGKPLQLVGGGRFLQQPIFARDLARLVLSLAGNEKTRGGIFCAAGPDIIESREYYRIIANLLDVDLRVDEIPVHQHLATHPEAAPFLCHRIYDLGKLRSAGVAVPGTSIEQGLREHVAELLKTRRNG